MEDLGPDVPGTKTAPAWREAERLAALERYAILGTAREALFDEIAQLAADVCEAPLAMVGFVAADRHWLKAELGVGTRDLPLDTSICRHAIQGEGLFVVPDLADDPRFAENPFVQAEGGIRFYAGAPLLTPDGLPLGTLCVYDFAPRPVGLAKRQERLLLALARQAMGEIELRRALAERDREMAEARRREVERRAAEERLRDSEAAYRALFEQAAVGVARVGLDGRFLEVNDRFCAIVGHPPEGLAGKHFLHVTHPDDVAPDLEKVEELLAGRIAFFAMEKRYVTAEGLLVWANLTVALVKGSDGAPAYFVSVIEDIGERKRIEDSRRLLLRELDHRVKNLFAIAEGMVRLTARAATTPREMARALFGRLAALARAHDLIQAAVRGREGAAEEVPLRGIAVAVLAPHLPEGDRLRIEGSEVTLGPRAATGLALVLHELATNAAKYGALSSPAGRLDLRWLECEGRLAVLWSETGGPPAVEPGSGGFGSRLARLTVEDQLGGTIAREWRPEGLRVVLGLPLARLAA